MEALSEEEVLAGLNALGDDWYEPQERQVRFRNDLAIGLGRVYDPSLGGKNG